MCYSALVIDMGNGDSVWITSVLSIIGFYQQALSEKQLSTSNTGIDMSRQEGLDLHCEEMTVFLPPVALTDVKQHRSGPWEV